MFHANSEAGWDGPFALDVQERLGDPHLVVLLRDRCSCTQDWAFPVASGNLYLPAIFFFPRKRDGFSHVHGFLSQRRHKPGVFLPPARTAAAFDSPDSPVEGFSSWYSHHVSLLRHLLTPGHVSYLWASLSAEWPGLGNAAKVPVSLVPWSTSRAQIGHLTPFCCPHK